mmetsp:Transcript_29990/g.77387  ORF Transcript_29990/g.77387 Transcript_29990/m.77387 type:complete len:81 (-) Transcript_29990:299-541(-)
MEDLRLQAYKQIDDKRPSPSPLALHLVPHQHFNPSYLNASTRRAIATTTSIRYLGHQVLRHGVTTIDYFVFDAVGETTSL